MRNFTKIRWRVIFVLCLFVIAQYAIAQNTGQITGTVTDGDNLPLIGVNVLVQGTNNGTATDLYR